MIAWAYLIAGIAAQVAGMTSLRVSDGMHRVGPTALTFLGFGVSVVLVARALDAGMSLAVGNGVWTGAGIAAIALVGAMAFDDRLNRLQLVGLVLVLIGSLVLQLGG